MNATKGNFTRNAILSAGALLATLAFGPYAIANPVRINFGGSAGNGYADLTLAPDSDSSTAYQPAFSQSDADNHISPPLSIYDPAGAQHITGANGSFTFTDGTSALITGLVPTSPGTAPPGETLPKSFSWFVAGADQYSYDNLFYANGSPLVCPPEPPDPYTFHGGFLDIFGAMFALDNGDVLALWSDGVTTPDAFGPGWPGGLTYGINLFSPTSSGGYTLVSSQFAGASARAAVPAPDFLWGFGAALLGLFAWRRSIERKRVPVSG